MEKSKLTTEDPELATRFNRILEQAVEALEADGIHYMFIGGIASGGLGRPRSTHDIDIFVVPEEAELALRALAKSGFTTEKTDPSWLYKAFKETILVDIIFKSKGEIYLDHEMYQRMITAEFHGKQLRIIAPEDLVIIKAVAYSEVTPGHWHDAVALLSYATIDWSYLIRRARRAPRRVLSLLLYAQSNDIWVPNWVIHELYSGIFEGIRQIPSSRPGFLRREAMGGAVARSEKEPTIVPAYAAAHLKQSFAEDPRTNELDIQVELQDNKILLRGEVQTLERREAVGKIAKEAFPSCQVENQVRVSDFTETPESEEVG